MMELIGIIVFILLIVLLIIAGAINIYTEFLESKRTRKPVCIVYLLRIGEDGKAEIKKAPKQDMWHWRF